MFRVGLLRWYIDNADMTFSFVYRPHSNTGQLHWSYEENDIRQGKEKEGVGEGVEVEVPYSRLLSW